MKNEKLNVVIIYTDDQDYGDASALNPEANYETPNLEPLLRLEWNKQDPNYLATFKVDSQSTIIWDIRVPCQPVTVLGGHAGCVNAVAWAPHSSCHICTAADPTLLVVKTAAAFTPVGQTISPKSGLPDFFTPQCIPAAKKPLGAVMVLFTISCSPYHYHENDNTKTKPY